METGAIASPVTLVADLCYDFWSIIVMLIMV